MNAVVPPAKSWGPLAALFPARLFRADQPATYLTIAWLMTFLPSIALSALVNATLSDVAQPEFPNGSWRIFFLVVVFAPVTETLIMGSVLLVLRTFLPPGGAVLVSAAGWGIAHSLQAAAWGLIIWWPFLIFSTAFLVWRERSLLTAFTLVSLLHALHNLLPALGLVLAP
ncbi:hypothetical protein [Sphingomonas arenae]|uniref:hypothetical protein n=1 Tax=Sphingomonas arenae TaxID=2812555 RepID=UPI0019674169|nr:hypothetical protein [Sphingomonas arenae]